MTFAPLSPTITHVFVLTKGGMSIAPNAIPRPGLIVNGDDRNVVFTGDEARLGLSRAVGRGTDTFPAD